MRKTRFLTGRQRLIFDFIRQKIYGGLPPTLREIADHFGFSVKAASDHLHAVMKKGYITSDNGRPRTLSLLPPYKDDTRHTYVVKTDVPELGIQKGDFLHIDTGELVTAGDVILSIQGNIKRFRTGDSVFGKITGISRPIEELT